MSESPSKPTKKSSSRSTTSDARKQAKKLQVDEQSNTLKAMLDELVVDDKSNKSSPSKPVSKKMEKEPTVESETSKNNVSPEDAKPIQQNTGSKDVQKTVESPKEPKETEESKQVEEKPGEQKSFWGGLTSWTNRVAEQVVMALDPEIEKAKLAERRAKGIVEDESVLPDIKGALQGAGHVLEGATESMFKFFDKTSDLVGVAVAQGIKTVEQSHLQEKGQEVLSSGLMGLESIGRKAMSVLSESAMVKSAHAAVVPEEELDEPDTSITSSQPPRPQSKTFMTLFDNSAGIGHLTALDMLATQAEGQLSSLAPSGKSQREFKAVERDLDTDVLLDDLESESTLTTDSGEIQELLQKVVGNLASSLPLPKLVEAVKKVPTIVNQLQQTFEKDILAQKEATKALEVEDDEGLQQTIVDSLAKVAEQATPSLVLLTSCITEILLRLAEALFIEHQKADESSKPTKLALTIRLLVGKFMGEIAHASSLFESLVKTMGEEGSVELKSTLTSLNEDTESSLAIVQEAVRHIIPLIKLMSK